MSQMLDNHFILSQCKLNSSRHINHKIDYLTDQKIKLQIEMNELKLNNSVLRKVTQQLMKDHQFGLKQLLQRNKELQDSYSELNNQNIKIKAQIFLAEQIKMDQQQQIKQIIKNYENKIIELRRLVQVKQAYVQILEDRDKYSKQQGYDNEDHIYLLNNSSFNYFNKLEEKNHQLQAALKQNMNLKQQNQKFQSEYNKICNKLLKIELLIRCKTTYLQLKNIIAERQSKSLPKNSVKLKFESQKFMNADKTPFNKINNESTMASTLKLKNKNSITQLSMQFVRLGTRNMMVQKILNKKVYENKKLKEKIVKLETKLQQNNIQLDNLKQSNLLYLKKYKNAIIDKNIYVQCIQNIIGYLKQRQIHHPQNHKNLNQFEENKKLSLTNNLGQKNDKQYKQNKIFKINWKAISNQIDISKVKHRRPTKTIKRSLSSILDYIKVEQQKQILNSEQTMNNSFEKEAFISNQFSQIFEEKQNDLASILAVGNSTKIVKTHSNKESNHIFENVLQNL